MILLMFRWFLNFTFSMLIVFHHVEYIAGKLPLMEDFSIMAPKVSQQTQCVFDKDLYEIGEKWKPNIEPFGVQYCILCECIAVQRKKESTIRVMAKVQCRNFKNDCPKPTCDNPVLLPERCCKSCPGDKNNLEEIIASQKMEEALLIKNFRKKFLAVLSPTADRSNDSRTGANISRSKAFLHINKQRLAFIIEVKSHRKPTYVRFQDLDDTIIEEYVVSGNRSKQPKNEHYLVFGSWAKVPKPYRSMIRKGHLKISISFSKDINVKSSLAGLIQKHTSLIQADLTEHESSYFDLMDSGFGKSEIFQTMLNTTSFVSYEDRNSLDRKALMDQSSSSSMNSIDSQLKCYYEAQIYEEGAQWKNQNDDCEMCFCQRGRVKCESEICLKLRCREQIRIEGQCCPICKSKLSSLSSHQNQSCFFEGDKKYHLIGSRWHPYIPPFGFDRCTVCMCTENAGIKCKRNECPPLPCAETDAYRENPMDCCKKCRAQTRSMMNYQDSMNNDQANSDDNVQQALATGSCHFRGKIYANGDEWHPTVDPYGEINCIKCGCKDGIHKCQRLKCQPTPPNCPKIIKKGECCPQCASISQNPSTSDYAEDFYSGGTRRVSTRTRF